MTPGMLELTASGWIMLSGSLLLPHALVTGVSMSPSIMACATWTPWGPNSRASDWLTARNANLPAEKEENRAEALRDAVAPETIKDGGCGEFGAARRSNGRVPCAKLKNESLCLFVRCLSWYDWAVRTYATPPTLERNSSGFISRNGLTRKPLFRL